LLGCKTPRRRWLHATPLRCRNKRTKVSQGKRVPIDPPPNRRADPLILLGELDSRVDSLYANSTSSSWQLSRAGFAAALERSVLKRFSDCATDYGKLDDYLETLHIDDLVLAAACMEGSEPAWEHFVSCYRSYLRAAAGVITKGSPSGTDALELADSLFAELFGLVDGKRGEASLLRYFHGRSSLKTWLRTILAQRHIDAIRRTHRFESLEHADGESEKSFPSQSVPVPTLDPHRSRYVRCFVLALTDSLATLPADDRKRLELYYAREKTLTEIGGLLGEHESSASRHLERARRELRAKVEEGLRMGRYSSEGKQKLLPLSDAEIALCFQYAAEDSPIDFRQIFPEKPAAKTEAGRKESS
jgi:RNA polymerase sigma-70 factor